MKLYENVYAVEVKGHLTNLVIVFVCKYPSKLERVPRASIATKFTFEIYKQFLEKSRSFLENSFL